MRKAILLVGGILLLLAAAAIPIQALLVLSILPPRYGAAVRMTNGAMQPSAQAAELANIQSSGVLAQVVSNLNLAGKWGERFKEGPLPLNVACGLLRRDLEVVHETGTRLIEIRMVSDIPDEAAAIANEVAEVYRASSLVARGANGKPVNEIVERAQPNARPVRSGKLKGVLVATGTGIILGGIGVALILAAIRRRTTA